MFEGKCDKAEKEELRDGNLIYYKAMTTEGNSGGPIQVRVDDWSYGVIGVHTGHDSDENLN